jgi:hypothetical protein
MSLIVAPIYCYGVWLTMSYFFSEFHDVAAPRLLDVASFEYAHTVNDVGDGLRCFFKGECVLAFSSLFPSRFLAMGGELLATLPFGLPLFILNALGSAGMRLPSQACFTPIHSCPLEVLLQRLTRADAPLMLLRVRRRSERHPRLRP